ncbi:efflux RND transporter periplasmic adaptor subunit [soil metagenome]
MTTNNKLFTRHKLWTALAALIAATGIGAALFGQQGSKAQAPGAQQQATPVSVATVAETEITAWDEFSGRLEAVERVDIRSRVAGAVQAVHFREGALVKTGDLLITIDAAPYAAEVERADAQVAAAQARVTNARSEEDRARRLWDEHAIAQREYEERQNAGREADANLRAAKAQLQTARLSLGYTQVRAPIPGRIGKIEVTVGNLVAAGPGAQVLTTLVSVSPIYASFDTDEQIITRALIGRIPVLMDTATPEAKPHEGHLQLIDNQVDARSGTIRVRAAFDNRDGSLIPGQFARLRMGQAHTQTALLVNERAVGTDQNKKFVLVAAADAQSALTGAASAAAGSTAPPTGQFKAEYREVTLGAPVNGLRVVTSGLKAGERIVVNGLQHVRPGAPIAPQAVAMDAKPEVQVAKQ